MIMKVTLLFGVAFSIYMCVCRGKDTDNLQDVCPTDTTRKNIFINGYPCKNPADITASDFKSSVLRNEGDTDNFQRSSTTIVTAAEFAGLNTLGLSTARTDLEVDGVVMPHAHPRASEMMFVGKGVVIAGFIDTKSQVFQKTLKEGDVFIVPRGLLHYSLNSGFEFATVYSVLSSHNPGVVSISDAMFAPIVSEPMKKLMTKLTSFSNNVTLFR
ncbi:germin-like protein 11-1 [Nicotiana tomentosiformis]|uniref:germin-like protein 11-1 n=1 Tax=Nicotiana tomentosiformis TaxID=4098 RepID=UPI00051BBAF3|nr:germin-like protein 11-1 [Nicotiana tomentosiformis]